MRYMIIMEASQQHYDAMSGKETEVPTWAPEELEAMFGFMNELNDDLVARGEWVDGQGLTAPAHARRVTRVDGEAVVTDGPYAETKENIVSFALLEVGSKEEALELSRRFWAIVGDGEGDIRLVHGPS